MTRKMRCCKRCNYIWLSVGKMRPKRCPRCKSRFWAESWVTQMLLKSKKELKKV